MYENVLVVFPKEFFQKIWSVDFLVFYGYYSRKPTDKNFAYYDKLIITTSYLRYVNSKTIYCLLGYNHEKEHLVSPSPRKQLIMYKQYTQNTMLLTKIL